MQQHNEIILDANTGKECGGGAFLPLGWWKGEREPKLLQNALKDKTLNYCSFYSSVPEKLTVNKKENTEHIA